MTVLQPIRVSDTKRMDDLRASFDPGTLSQLDELGTALVPVPPDTEAFLPDNVPMYQPINYRTRLETAPTQGDVIGAMFSTEAWYVRVPREAYGHLATAMRWEGHYFEPDAAFDVNEHVAQLWESDSVPPPLLSRYLQGQYADVRSLPELGARFEADLERERAHHLMEQAGLRRNLVAGLLVGLGDPLNLVAGVGMGKLLASQTARGTGIVARVGRAVQTSTTARVGAEVASGAAAQIAGDTVLALATDDIDLDFVVTMAAHGTVLNTIVQGFWRGIARGLSGRELEELGEAVKRADAEDLADAATVEVSTRHGSGKPARDHPQVMQSRDEPTVIRNMPLRDTTDAIAEVRARIEELQAQNPAGVDEGIRIERQMRELSDDLRALNARLEALNRQQRVVRANTAGPEIPEPKARMGEGDDVTLVYEDPSIAEQARIALQNDAGKRAMRMRAGEGEVGGRGILPQYEVVSLLGGAGYGVRRVGAGEVGRIAPPHQNVSPRGQIAPHGPESQGVPRGTPPDEPMVQPPQRPEAEASPEQISLADMPEAGPRVDGREVLADIPNQDSIRATFEDFEWVGVREIPLAEFPGNVFAAADDLRRSRILADEIAESGQIKPLIIGIDADGDEFIIEGHHRLQALVYLEADSFPALIVRETPDAGGSPVTRSGAEGPEARQSQLDDELAGSTEPEMAMGAAAGAQLNAVRFDNYRPVGGEDLGAGRAQTATADTAAAVGRAAGRARLQTATAQLRDASNGVVRVVHNAIEETPVPRRGNLTGSIYSGQTMDVAIDHTRQWRADSVAAHEDLAAEVADAMGVKAIGARRAGERLGLPTMRRARQLINDVQRDYAAQGRIADEVLALENLAQRSPGQDAQLTRLHDIAQAFDLRIDRYWRSRPGVDRGAVEAAFDRFRTRQNQITAGSIDNTPVGRAIEQAHARSRDIVAVQIDPEQVRTGRGLQTTMDQLDAADAWRGHPEAKDAEWFRVNRRLDINNPDHVRLIIDEINQDNLSVRINGRHDVQLDMVNNDGVRFSNIDTIRKLSEIRNRAIHRHYLDLLARELHLPVGESFRSIDDIAHMARSRAREAGVDADDLAAVRRSDSEVRRMVRMWNILTDDSVRTSDHPILEATLGGLRRLATATLLLKTPFSLVNEGWQEFAVRMSRSDDFFDAISNEMGTLSARVRAMSAGERDALAEYLGSFRALAERPGGRGAELTGIDAGTGSARSGRQVLEEPGGFADMYASIVLSSTEQIMDLATAGRLMGAPLPVLRQLSIDGLTNLWRRRSIIGHSNWLFDRVEDFAKVRNELQRFGNTEDVGAVIKRLRDAGELQHNIRPGDYARVSEFLADHLDALVDRKRTGTDVREAGGVTFFTGHSPETRAWRDFLDNVALQESTTTPTVGTRPLSTQEGGVAAEGIGIMTQFFNFPWAFANQNVQLTKLRHPVTQGFLFSGLVGMSMLDLFMRDWLTTGSVDEAVELWHQDTDGVAKRVEYINRILMKTGYLGVADKLTSLVIGSATGDPFQQRIGAEHAVIPPALGYSRDLVRAIQMLPRLVGPGELTQAERELIRKTTIATHMIPLRVFMERALGLFPNDDDDRDDASTYRSLTGH